MRPPLSLVSNAAICSAIDFETVMFEGAKFEQVPDVVGGGSEQFTAQQNRAASAAGDLPLLLALSQHFIILSLGE